MTLRRAISALASATRIHQGDLLTYAFPVWNLGTANAVHEVLNTQVPAGTIFDYIRISGNPRDWGPARRRSTKEYLVKGIIT